MPAKFLVDTDVLIDFLRGISDAVNFVRNHAHEISFSAISVEELYAGVREGQERRTLDNFVAAFGVIPVTSQTGKFGGLYRRDYGKSHNVGLADAVVAATAETEKLELVTLNRKHFPMLKKITSPYQKSGSS